MAEDADWRLHGQEKHLKGITLVHRPYRRYPQNLNWDHDHCLFCMATFMAEDYPDVLHVGYATEDEYHWICETCFQDFAGMFEWTVREHPDLMD